MNSVFPDTASFGACGHALKRCWRRGYVDRKGVDLTRSI